MAGSAATPAAICRNRRREDFIPGSVREGGPQGRHSMMLPAGPSRSSLLQELRAPPRERGLEPVPGPDLVELPAGLGGGRIERGHHVETRLQRVAKACVLDPA